MNDAVAVAVCSAFVAIALWHFHMALFAGPSGESAAVPIVNGKPLFMPSARSTAAVGVALMMAAVLVAATSGMLWLGLPLRVLSWLSFALALGLLARAIGEFKYVGFFKRVRGTRFAAMDSLLYSPLCLLLSGGVATVAMRNTA
jgi:hypothetical protein